jgi:hypothetical protein
VDKNSQVDRQTNLVCFKVFDRWTSLQDIWHSTDTAPFAMTAAVSRAV